MTVERGGGDPPEPPRIPAALKLGIAAAVGFGAVATGMFLSRRGRHLVREALEGRRRTRLEDRVLDALWGDRVLSRRHLDVAERGDRDIELTGEVRSGEEAERAVRVVERVAGVGDVLDRLVVSRSGRRRPS
jgi:hypothetical protein